ncbi:uncharacterized protein DUF1573 [Neolewinella xylanilytica]|uniref:Uncharacterized protein DUF1573 n=1 Tax=Neolewinella xylanilytica TaxID=1514080 RepID=A0A2S6I622_9BACT|nr:DUF1573 domain-containing protein [Neolewinella xylanilytica]PPK86618.1 uncharacterized protein DUF1573 [Neolewinella xylanilytica]
MIYLILTLSLLAPPDSPVEWLQPATVTLEDTFQDEAVTYRFEFRNLTDEPLLVDNVRVGCGCTASKFSETPVAPGETGTIEVTYDAASPGYYRKYVKVFFAGHRGGHKLWMEGFVESTE